jgi:hypothetical protein
MYLWGSGWVGSALFSSGIAADLLLISIGDGRNTRIFGCNTVPRVLEQMLC